MTVNASSCSSCGEPLDLNGDCMSCAFSEALASDSDLEQEETTANFGDFAPLEAGDFGRYTLKSKRGEGGMGTVWEAEDSVLQRSVALKVIRGFAFATEREELRFRTEATAIAQLDHPNIVPIYDIGNIDGQPFFTMKHLEGGTLSTRLAEGPLDISEAARIMEKIARAIHHAHERNVLHRDIKPDNVLFDSDGEPYLSDFGLAKLLTSETQLTQTIAQIGTPHYMSPEQARGEASAITVASDVWSAGALFYRMLTGQLPFPGASSEEILNRVSNQEPVPMHRSKVQVPPQLETLCTLCMQKYPKHRLPSAKVLADELKRWLAGQPIHSKRVSRSTSALRWLRRHPWQVAASVAIGCLLTAIVVFGPSINSREEIRQPGTPSTAHEATSLLPKKFTMETYSIDGDRQGPRFFIGWMRDQSGLIPEDWDRHPVHKTYIFQFERDNIDGGVALRVTNYHLAEEGKNYYLPYLSHHPVIYRVAEPLWQPKKFSADPSASFLSLTYHGQYLRHSGRRLFNHPLYIRCDEEKDRRIFEQDSTWTVHPFR